MTQLRERFGRMRIGAKLTLAFGLVLGLTLALGAGSLLSLARVNAASGELAAKWLPSVGHADAMRAAMLEHRELLDKHTKAPDASYMAEYEDKMAARAKAIEDEAAAYEKLLGTDEERALFDAYRKAWSEYLPTANRIVGLSRAGKQDDAREIAEGAGKMSHDEAVAALDRLTALGFDGGRRTAQSADVVYRNARLLAAGLLAAAMLTGVVLAIVITRSLLGQLGGEPGAAA
ncbi:MAG TPA: MCP four helix bundle domain-containing protein [Burkholderiaceae bacterium]